jgi:hypothetical protein
MAKKRRIEYSFLASTENSRSEQGAEGMRDDSDAMDVDSVKAMVNGVKNRGVCFFFSLSLLSLGGCCALTTTHLSREKTY